MGISQAPTMGEVTLHSFWPSSFGHRVIWALKLKGIDYEYIEEDIFNKSEMLLKYNPVYKKVPVLVHDGKPIAESSVILEYIEETWPHKPLLPKDAHERALARFWIKYGEKKRPSSYSFLRSEEEKQKAITETLDFLRTVEDQCLGDRKFFGGNDIGLVDIEFGWLGHWLGALEEVIGIKLLDPERFPRLHSWVGKFNQVPEIKENLPDWNKLLDYMRRARDKFALQFSSNVEK